MNTRMGRVAIGAAMATTALMALGMPAAQAYTFTFDDLVFVSCTNFRCTNGPANFSAVFPNYTGGAGFSRFGYYQVLDTGNGVTWSGLTPGTNPAPSYIFRASAGPSLIEYIQNDPNFGPNGGLQGTEGEDYLQLSNDWTSSAFNHNGQVVDNVTASAVNASFDFIGLPAPNGLHGAQTDFTFNGFDLTGTASGAIFEVLDSLGNVLYTSQPLNLTGTAQHITVNIPNAWQVKFTALPNGSVTMDNVEIDGPIPTRIPEPATIALLGAALLGLGVWRRRRNQD